MKTQRNPQHKQLASPDDLYSVLSLYFQLPDKPITRLQVTALNHLGVVEVEYEYFCLDSSTWKEGKDYLYRKEA